MTKPRSVLKSGWAIVNGRGRMTSMCLNTSERWARRVIKNRVYAEIAAPDTERPERVDVVVRTQTKRKKR